MFTKSEEEEPADKAPVIVSKSPIDTVLYKKLNDTVTFKIGASDADGDEIEYKNIVNGSLVDYSSTFTFNIEELGTYTINMIAYNALADTVNWTVYVENSPPIVSNVIITPTNPTFEDTLYLSYDYSDHESDNDQSIIEWFNHDALIQTGGTMLLPSEINRDDVISVKVVPYDGELQGNPVTSDGVIIQPLPYRILSGNITEFFSQAPDEGVQMISSLDTAYTDANGDYALTVSSLQREDILLLKEGRFESGIILNPSLNDTVINEVVAKDDSLAGIDREFFGRYVVGEEGDEGTPQPTGKYVFLTEESVPDTVWILGDIIDGDYAISMSLRSIEVINTLGRKLNTVAVQTTGGLFNNNTTILIADSNYIDNDFDYPNMKAINNELFPVETFNPNSNYCFIVGYDGGGAFNGTLFEDDVMTIKGNFIKFGNLLTDSIVDYAFDTEFCSSILGGVETQSGYNSVLSPTGGPITAQDQRVFDWVKYRGPGRNLPDLSEGFKQEFIDRFKNNY